MSKWLNELRVRMLRSQLADLDAAIDVIGQKIADNKVTESDWLEYENIADQHHLKQAAIRELENNNGNA